MQHLIEFLNKLVDDFSWRRLSLIFSCLFLIVIAIVAFEFYTSYLFLAKTEKTLNLIKQITSLPPEVTVSSKESLAKLTRSIVIQLNDVTNTKTSGLAVSPLMLKIISTSIPWLLVLLIGLVVEKNDQLTFIGGIFAVWIVGVIIGVSLPWQNTIWSNYWVYPLVHFLIIIWAVVAFGNRKK